MRCSLEAINKPWFDKGDSYLRYTHVREFPKANSEVIYWLVVLSPLDKVSGNKELSHVDTGGLSP